MSRATKAKTNPSDLVLIPQQFYQMLSKMTSEGIMKGIDQDLNVDEVFHNEIIMGYSYYEALNPEQRYRCKIEVAKIELCDFLCWVALNKPELFTFIDDISSDDNRVIPWFKRQLIRIKTMFLSFDELLNRGKGPYE